MDKPELEAHLEWYANFLLKVDRWAADPNSPEARELLEEHEALILDVEIDRLGRHLAHEAASSKPLRPGGGYSTAGALAAAAEIVYLLGKAHMGDYAYLVAGDLARMAEGRGSLLALEVPRAKQFGDIINDVEKRIVLLGHFLAERDGGRWIDKLTCAVSERTLKTWVLQVSHEDRQRARSIGKLVGPLDPEQQAFVDYILRYSLDELIQVHTHPPGRGLEA